jgi:hypothetical protein
MMTIPLLSSDDVIEIMIDTVFEEAKSLQYRDKYREALHSLVRLARAEQLLEMQRDFVRMTEFCDTRSQH